MPNLLLQTLREIVPKLNDASRSSGWGGWRLLWEARATVRSNAHRAGLYLEIDGGARVERIEPSAPGPAFRFAVGAGPLGALELASSAVGSPMPSWDDLVRQHADRVYRLAYRLSGNQHDAEDLTQETFIRVFRSVQNYQPGTFEGWLHRITTNLFLDMVRRRGRIRMEALPEDYERVPASDPDPEQIYHDSRLGADLQAALDSLAPEFRAAVVLCDIEGLSYEEIGATLGVKLGTVRSRIHRGRQGIREYLAAHSQDSQYSAESA